MTRLVVALTLAAALAGCDSQPAATPQPQQAPASRPAEPPKDAPPPKPAPKPFDRASAKTPWVRTKVGDWATYRTAAGRVKQVKFEVTAVTDTSVTFVRKNAETGAVLGDATIDIADEDQRYKPWESYDALVEPPYKEGTTVAGKELEVLIIKRAASGNSTELWVAEQDVPPFNQCAVKSIRNGDLELELLDWGRAE
ncbi:MAG: hypothetical protein M9894_09020 [Planctomycetes bacterium]|nr:hypothetical protein [Planctomycetota bacterium]